MQRHLNKITLSLRDSAINFQDRIPMAESARKFKDGGQLVAPASIARTGIMQYRAKELGELFKDMDPEAVINVMTREEDLFDAESLETYRGAPITIGHPAEDVTIENAKELQHGMLDGMPARAEDQLTATVIISDAEAINLIESGVQELSSGHSASLVRVADEDVEALGYHAYKTNIRCNHIAIVKRGRAGDAKIADEEMQVEEEVEEVVQEQLLDSEPEVKVEQKFSDEFVQSLQDQLEESTAKIKELEVALADAQKVNFDEAVSARVALIQQAARFSDADFCGMSDVEIKRQVLKDNCAKDYSDRTDSFIETRYEVFMDTAGEEGITAITAAFQDMAKPPKEEEKQLSPRDKMIARIEHRA